MAVPGGRDEPCVSKGEEVAGDAGSAALHENGERRRGHGRFQVGENERAGSAQQPPERIGRSRRRMPEVGDPACRIDDRRQPGLVDNRRDMRPQVRTRHEHETAFVDPDRPPSAIAERETLPRPADLRVQPVEDAAETMPRQHPRTLVDVAIEQEAHANPERRHELFPRLMKTVGEQLSRSFRVGREVVEHLAASFVLDALATAFELPPYLGRSGRPNLSKLIAEARPRRLRRRGQEVRHVAVPGQDGDESTQIEPGSTGGDESKPRPVVGARAQVCERLHRRLRLPHRRPGEAHVQHIVARSQREQRHRPKEDTRRRESLADRGLVRSTSPMPGASEQTRRVAIANANWVAGADGADGEFNLQLITTDEERHTLSPSPAAMAALLGLIRGNTVLAWDPESSTLIAANLVGTMPWTERAEPGPAAER
jgi:hypothetical protein